MRSIALDTAVNALLALFVLFLSERLAKLIRPTVQEYVYHKLDLAGARKIEVLSLLIITSDFSATVGAIITAAAALIFEIWKIRDHFPEFFEYAYLLIMMGMLLAIYRLAQSKWLVGDASVYERGIGRNLKWIARVLAILLAMFPLGEKLADTLLEQAPSPAAAVPTDAKAPFEPHRP